MKTILHLFSSNLLATSLVFLALFFLIASLFAKERLGQMLQGLLRILASIFYSPFVYMKRAVLSLADHGVKGETEFSKTKQYLMNKLMLMLQALLVIFSLAVLSAGIVAAWNSMLPPKHVREFVKNLKMEIKTNQTDLAVIEPQVKQMEQLWNTQRDSLIKAYKEQRNKNIETLRADNLQLEKQIYSNSGDYQNNLEIIKNYLSQNEYQRSARQYARVKEDVQNYLERTINDSAAKTRLQRYISNWYSLMLSKLEIDNFSESQLRAAVQPNYKSMKEKAESLPQTISRQESQLAEAKSAAKLRFPAFFLGILISLAGFLAVVWVIGLIIEGLWMGLHMAGNIEKIRDKIELKS
mgnify:CR=1 FL=1